jgi:Spy/CpxP family protein refolding chaperone
MKLRITLLLLAAALMVAACGQNESSNPTSLEATASVLGDPGSGPVRWAEELGLTDDQIAQVTAIFESHREERAAIREARRNGTSWEGLKEQHKALRARVHGELADVLTADQLAKLDELHKNRPRHRRGSMSQEDHVARMDQRLEKLTETLGLTPEQTEQLRALFEEHHANRPARGEGPPDPEVRSQRHDGFLSKLEGILTPEQLEQFKEMRPRRGPGGRHGGPGGPHGCGFGRGQG